jgi:hypothetical protein
MKVIRNTPHQLILDSKPWLAGIIVIVVILVSLGVGLAAVLDGEFIFGLVFMVAGGGIGGLCFAMIIRRNQLILDRSRNLIEMRRRTMFGMKTRDFDLRDLTEAITQSSRSNEGADTHRLALMIDGHAEPFTDVYTSGKGADRAAEVVNNWLDGRAQL